MPGSGVDEATTTSDDLSPGVLATDDIPIEENMCLHVCTTTWARDSHELFDYEARHVHKRSFFLSEPARIFRTVAGVQVLHEGDPLPSLTADYLLSIRHQEGRFIVVPADKNIQSTNATAIYPKKIWLIVKDLPSKSHFLREGDVMKLGRFKLRVKQLVKAGHAIQELKLDDTETPHSAVKPEEALCMQCRICLLDGGTCEDPLVCPCQCKGSIKYVHLDCLRHWINGRLSLSDEDQQHKVSFFFKQLQCELCRTPFPSALIVNNERVPIVKVPKVEAPFIILENIVGTANRGLHVISMEVKKELKLGRGHESDVRIADVSISRYHATIRFFDGEFVLEDHDSKFGTLVSLRKVQPVDTSHTLAVQVGRTILNMSLRKRPCHSDSALSSHDDEDVPTTVFGHVSRPTQMTPPPLPSPQHQQQSAVQSVSQEAPASSQTMLQNQLVMSSCGFDLVEPSSRAVERTAALLDETARQLLEDLDQTAAALHRTINATFPSTVSQQREVLYGRLAYALGGRWMNRCHPETEGGGGSNQHDPHNATTTNQTHHHVPCYNTLASFIRVNKPEEHHRQLQLQQEEQEAQEELASELPAEPAADVVVSNPLSSSSGSRFAHCVSTVPVRATEELLSSYQEETFVEHHASEGEQGNSREYPFLKRAVKPSSLGGTHFPQKRHHRDQQNENNNIPSSTVHNRQESSSPFGDSPPAFKSSTAL